MLLNLLASATSAVTSAANEGSAPTKDYTSYLFFGVMIVLIIVYFIFSSRQRKKQREEIEKKMDGIVVGDKITTIGMWVGEVVEILPDGKYVLKTGSDEHTGYITIDRQAIYTIAKPEDMAETEELPTEPPTGEETEDKPVFEETAQSPAEEATEESTEDKPVEEATEEPKAAEEDVFAEQRKATLNGEPRE